MGRRTWMMALALVVSVAALVGCERGASTESDGESGLDARLDEEDPRTAACYHFETSGAIEVSGTCADYHVEMNDEGGWTLTLVAPPAMLVMEIPTALAPGQYGLRAREEAQGDESLIGVEVNYQPLDGPEERFGKDVTGTMTVMHLDEERVSALFDFGALPRSAATPEGIEVRGHLRDLSLQR